MFNEHVLHAYSMFFSDLVSNQHFFCVCVLRVEFQSKFYEGDGVSFQPFTFKELLKIDSIEDLK